MEEKLNQLIAEIDAIIKPGKKQPLTYLIAGKPTEVIFNPHTDAKAYKLQYNLNPLYHNKFTEKILDQQARFKELDSNDLILTHLQEGGNKIEVYLIQTT